MVDVSFMKIPLIWPYNTLDFNAKLNCSDLTKASLARFSQAAARRSILLSSQAKATIFGWNSNRDINPCLKGFNSPFSLFKVTWIQVIVKFMGNKSIRISEELGYLVDAIINTGEIASFENDQNSGIWY